jgi:hypothetical protein
VVKSKIQKLKIKPPARDTNNKVSLKKENSFYKKTGIGTDKRIFSTSALNFKESKNIQQNKSIITMDKLLFYKKSRNEKGYIHLVVYIDYENIMLLPILNVEKYLLIPLIKTSTTIKTIEIISQMLYDIKKAPHLYIVNNFIINHLKNNNLNITSNVGIKNKKI